MTTAEPLFVPIARRERDQFLDVLRGVAVLGILIANIRFMGLAGPLVDPMFRDATDLDLACHAFTDFFAETKFITLFSLMFGAGLAVMAQRAEQRGVPFAGTLARRLGLLLLIGLVHGTLIWPGDILASYAVIGFVALGLSFLPLRALPVIAVGLLLSNAVLFIGVGLLDPNDMVETTGDQTAAEVFAAKTAEVTAVFASGDFVAMAATRVGLYAEVLVVIVVLFGARTLALFLLGMALVRSGFLEDHDRRAHRCRRWASIGIPVGFAAMALVVHFDLNGTGATDRVLRNTLLYFGGLVLAAGYAGLIGLWCASPSASALRDRVAAVGRMALTSYLSHSVITAVLFNYLGLFGTLSRLALLGVVVAIYAVQLVLSPWWLARFRYGPMEWLWRCGTYRHRFPLRVATS